MSLKSGGESGRFGHEKRLTGGAKWVEVGKSGAKFSPISAMLTLDQGLYVGEHRHKLDAKNRLTVPSKWRFEGDENGLYLAFPTGNCLTVYPPRMVQQLKEKMATIGLGDKKTLSALTKIMGQADSFSLDKQGRIIINDKLYKRVGIDKEAVLVGTINKFHIWNPESYEEFIAQDDEGEDPSDILSSLGL